MNQTISLENCNATITTYLLDTKQNLPVVVICPGGAYSWRSEREGEPVATAFNQIGFHAVVLNYDVTPELLGDGPLYDLSAAVSYLRTNANDLHIKSQSILLCGFSAGGHLAASLGVFWNDVKRFPEYEARQLHKPNGLILCYPVISAGTYAHRNSINRLTPDSSKQWQYSLEHHVTKDTPPVFLWHTMTDHSVPVQNSILFASACIEHDVSCEVMLFPRGEHGLSLATKEVENESHPDIADSHIARWFGQCQDWIQNVVLCN